MHIDGLLFRLNEVADAITLPLYVLRVRRPWSLGCYTMKKSSIEAALDSSAVRAGQSCMNVHFAFRRLIGRAACRADPEVRLASMIEL